ncbi:PKD domain containing protein [Dactylosporangium sp. NPDC006015]|uniref:PKD domain containing protein n=1 Tax=Dactylosporangium sp. NPDC006015 TaxID=3154576 RepID=UPI0033B9D3BB
MRRTFTAVAVLVSALVMAAGAAVAGQALQGVVSQQPVVWTPNVLDGAIAGMAVVGDIVVVGGNFTTVADAATGSRAARRSLFAFQLGTGRMLDFAPELNGRVTAVAAGPGGTVYAAGTFTKVNGDVWPGLVQLDLATGSRVAGFTGTAGPGQIRTMTSSGAWLYAGGHFTAISGQRRAGLARLSATAGVVDPGFDLRLARRDGGTVKVESVAVTQDGNRLAAVGAFDTAAGMPRAQLLLADVGGGPAAVSGWSTDAYTRKCKALYDSYLRGVDFAPDGSYLAVAATGGMAGPTLMCDSVARFDVTGSGVHPPVWVNRTGGNTLWSVAVTDAAVYVGGHQQWMDNPRGRKNAGPGAVPRPGIAAVDPVTGKALAWNPTHSRGVGVEVLVTCSAGLLVGSDTDQLGRAYHGRIGLLPATGT